MVKHRYIGMYYLRCIDVCDGMVRSKCSYVDCSGQHEYLFDEVIAIITSIPKNVNHDYQEGDFVYRFSGDCLIKVIYKNNMKRPEELLPYKWWILYENCKLAVMEISKCLLKSKIYKDVRLLIAKEVWNTRNDYLWRMKERKSNKKMKV